MYEIMEMNAQRGEINVCINIAESMVHLNYLHMNMKYENECPKKIYEFELFYVFVDPKN